MSIREAMRLSKLILFIFLFSELNARDIINGKNFGTGIKQGSISILEGSAFQHCPDSDSAELIPGDSIGNNCYVITSKDSYMRVVLSDNSIAHLGPNSALQIGAQEKQPELFLKQGQLRLLNFKLLRMVHSSLGKVEAAKGEFLWSLGSKEGIGEQFFVFSGDAKLNGEKLEETPDLIYSYNLKANVDATKAWKKYFLGLESSDKPLYQAKFSSRSLASMDGPVDNEIAEFEEFLEEEPSRLPVVKKKIWVHDIIYDAVSKAVENASLKKADEIIPSAIEAACSDLVWEVANKSVIRWGTKYAYVAGAKEVPRSVATSLKEAKVEGINLYDKELFQKSAEEIAEIRSYRRAKSAAEVGGYQKGWREAQRYAMDLIPEVVLPVTRELIYLEAKKAGDRAAKMTLKQTKLLMTDDVDQLVEHLSQVASKKIAMARINKYSAYYSEIAAKKAALEIAKASSEEIAKFVSSKASSAAGKIMQQKIAERRAKSVARSIASQNKVNDARNAQSHSNQTIREVSR